MKVLLNNLDQLGKFIQIRINEAKYYNKAIDITYTYLHGYDFHNNCRVILYPNYTKTSDTLIIHGVSMVQLHPNSVSIQDDRNQQLDYIEFPYPWEYEM